MTARHNLELNLGKLCNNRCVFCLDSTAPQESRRWVPPDRAAAELQRAFDDGVRSVGLLGGEPTAHPQILDIVTTARSIGFTRISLSTNALKLADASFAEALVEAGATRFTVSIHSHRSEDEDELSGRTGNFHRKLTAIRTLVSLRQRGLLPDNVSLNPVITTRLVGMLPEFAAAFRAEGIRDIRYNLVRTDACPEQGDTLTPTLTTLTPQILRTAVVNVRALRMTLAFGDVPLCAYPWEVLSNRSLARQTVGEARDLETRVAVFSAPKDPQREASRFRWSDRKRTALKVKPESSCAECHLADPCEGIWRSYVDVHSTEGLQAVRHAPEWLRGANR